MKTLLVVAALISSGSAAQAADILRNPERAEGRIVVWRDRDQLREGTKLVDAGVRDSKVIMRYVSCVVPGGTRAVVLDHGTFTAMVAIADGENAGCRGAIWSDLVAPKP